MPAGLGGAVAGERLYSLDFGGVTDSLKGMQQIRAQDQGRGGHVLSGKNASESFSTISTPFRYGVVPGDAGLEKESGDGDSVILRPSKLLRGEVMKPWLEKRDWRISASWWITVVRFFFSSTDTLMPTCDDS